MDRTPWLSAFVMLLNLMLYTLGSMTKPENVTLHIWEGNVTVTWNPPQENPVDCLYQVQVSDFSVTPNVWKNVSGCSLIKATTCNVGLVSHELRLHVRVGVLMHQGYFSWIKKMINIRESNLFPPSFSLFYTPFSIQVKVHRKKLPRVFPYDLDYTAYLWLEGQENQAQSDDDPDEDGEIEFSSLRPWHTYCVRVQVKSRTDASNISTECVQLPPDMTLILCFVFLGLLGFVALLLLFCCCFMKRPKKMPDALKPVVNKWQPMTVGSVQVETVIDKGWLLITSKNADKWQISEKKAEFTNEEKDWRESLDSGVSMEQLQPSFSSTSTDGQTGDILEDSGCGSLEETEGSRSVRKPTAELRSLQESHDGKNQESEDSGLGLGPKKVINSLEGDDNRLLSVVGDGYRSQSPSSVDVKIDTLKGYDANTNVAVPSGGYRSGQVICMCSDHEYCKCKKSLTENCQSVTPVQINSSHTNCETVDGNSAVSTNWKKNLLGMEDTQLLLPQADMSLETSPFLFSQTSLIDMHSFTLDDVKLAF